MGAGTTTPPVGRELYLSGRGRTWFYDTGPRGVSGRPVVLLHGWTSTAALNWFRCIPALAAHHRVVALDHRGHGRGIRSRRPFRLEDCADDVAALSDKLGLGPVTAVGYSMGGPIAQLLWKRHPEAVGGLVLCATASRFAPRRDWSGAAGALGYGMAVALSGVPASVRQQGMSRLVRARLAEAGMADWAIDEWARNDPAALMHAGLAISRFDSGPWIGEVSVPVGVVITEQDSLVAPAIQRRLAASIPGARVFPVQGDHRACADQADAFVPALLAACDAVSR